jgi:hypothetical protein
MTNRECRNQLDWSAFCYAAGEMSPAEVTEFEARLADDQAAREALARAVELTQIVAAAESQVGDVVLPASHRSASWTVRLSWMAIGGLAVLLLGLFWTGAIWPSANTVRQFELAAAWTETRAELSSAKAAGLWPSVSSHHGDADDDLPGNDALLDAVALDETPSWMDAAVLGMTDEADGALGPVERLEN